MPDFLEELQNLLNTHNAAIIRSANKTNSLVASVQTGPSTFVDVEFEEDIDESQIKQKNYEYIRMA